VGRSKVIIDIAGNAENFKRSLDQIKRETRSLEQSLQTVATRGAIAFAGLSTGIGLAVSQAAKFEQIDTQFEVLIGNTEEAQAALEDLKDFSTNTNFQFDSIAKAGQQLLGFGFSADELRPKLEQIGNVAAAIGKPIDDIGLIFGQVSAAGKLTGERLLQFQERAIPIGPAIAETLGIAESEVKEFVSKGLVDFATFEKAFASLSKEGGIAFNALEKQSGTTSGQFSNLKDNVSFLAADLGKEFLPVVKSTVGALTGLIKVVRENPRIVKFGAVIIGVATAFAGLTTVVGVTGLAIVKFSTITTLAASKSAIFAGALNLLGGAARFAGTSVRFLFANPIGLAITALIAAGFAAYKFRNELSAAFGAAFDVVKIFVEQAGTNLRAFGKILKGIATFDVSQIKEGFADLASLGDLGTRAASSFSDGYSRRMEEFRAEERAKEEEAKAKRLEMQETENAEKLELMRELENQKLELKAETDAQETELEKKKLQDQLKDRKSIKDQDLKLKKETTKKVVKLDQDEKKLLNQNEDKFLSTTETLTRSSNKSLFNVGKAASISQALINTYEGASKALAQGGIIGPALAAAVTAAGLTQVANIQAQTFQAAQGFSGSGSAFGESFVSTFTPREIVVPERFSEGIKKGEFSLSGPNQNAPGGAKEMQVTIGFRDDAFEIIEEKLIERETLGTSLRG